MLKICGLLFRFLFDTVVIFIFWICGYFVFLLSLCHVNVEFCFCFWIGGLLKNCWTWERIEFVVFMEFVVFGAIVFVVLEFGSVFICVLYCLSLLLTIISLPLSMGMTPRQPHCDSLVITIFKFYYMLYFVVCCCSTVDWWCRLMLGFLLRNYAE